MIFGSINTDDISIYPQAIQRAIRHAFETDFTGYPDGRHEIVDDNFFGQLWHVSTKPIEETRPELHKKYIDVQCWLEGEEMCGIAPKQGIGNLVEAIEPRDLYLYDGVADEGFVKCTKGCFAVFFPSDAHRPGVNVGGEAKPVTKVVVKVAFDLLKA